MPRPFDPTKRFQGPPCAKCGGTERHKGNRSCVSCDLERNRIRYAEDPDYRERQKESVRIHRQDPKVRERKRKLDRIRFQDPEVRERKRKLDRIRCQDPIHRDLHNGRRRSSRLNKKRQRVLLRMGMTADAIFKALDEVKGHEAMDLKPTTARGVRHAKTR